MPTWLFCNNFNANSSKKSIKLACTIYVGTKNTNDTKQKPVKIL